MRSSCGLPGPRGIEAGQSNVDAGCVSEAQAAYTGSACLQGRVCECRRAPGAGPATAIVTPTRPSRPGFGPAWGTGPRPPGRARPEAPTPSRSRGRGAPSPSPSRPSVGSVRVRVGPRLPGPAPSRLAHWGQLRPSASSVEGKPEPRCKPANLKQGSSDLGSDRRCRILITDKFNTTLRECSGGTQASPPG